MPRMPCGAAGVSGDGADTHRCRPGTGRPVLAVVLAAGRGTRMAPLTSELPKGLLPTLDAPHLSWVLASVARAGLRRGWGDPPRPPNPPAAGGARAGGGGGVV